MRILVLVLLAGTALADDVTVIGDRAPYRLTEVVGEVAEGERVFADREAGHCVLCHQVSSLEVPFQGDIGPALSDVGLRLDAAQIRLRIIDASLLNPETIMPPYYRHQGLSQVAPEYVGETVLSAAQIEHLVAYLSTLKGAGDD